MKKTMQSDQIIPKTGKRKKVYLVLTTMRTGSTMLTDYLQSAGIFNGNNLRSNELLHFSNMGKMKTECLKNGINAVYIKAVESQKSIYRDIQITGFKILGGQLKKLTESETFSNLTAVKSIAVIFLRRRNKVQQAISHLRAEKEGLWHKKTIRHILRNFIQFYSREKISAGIAKIELMENFICAFLGQNNSLPLELYYEDICTNTDVEILKIFSFLGLPLPNQLVVKTDYRKVRGLKSRMMEVFYNKHMR